MTELTVESGELGTPGVRFYLTQGKSVAICMGTRMWTLYSMCIKTSLHFYLLICMSLQQYKWLWREIEMYSNIFHLYPHLYLVKL